MAFIFNPVGLGNIVDEDNVMGLIGKAVSEGRMIKGYLGNIYSHYKFGKSEIYSSLQKNNSDKYSFSKADLHVSGDCVWEVRCNGIDCSEDGEAGLMTKFVGISNLEGEGFSIINLLNADVLPSIMKNDRIIVQVAALCEQIHYYENEDEFSKDMPIMENAKCEELNGKKIAPAIGSILPNAFLNNHSIYSTEEEIVKTDDWIMIVTGKVIGAQVKYVELEGEPIAGFIVTKIETIYGDLDLIHSKDMISEGEMNLIKEGAIVQALAIISADPAIYEYENGYVKNSENNIKALKYAMIEGNADRLRDILDDNAVYHSKSNKDDIIGKDNIIERLNYVHEGRDDYFAYMATLTEDKYREKRCFVLTEGDKQTIGGVVRIECNDDGLITNIYVEQYCDLDFELDYIPGVLATYDKNELIKKTQEEQYAVDKMMSYLHKVERKIVFENDEYKLMLVCSFYIEHDSMANLICIGDKRYLIRTGDNDYYLVTLSEENREHRITEYFEDEIDELINSCTVEPEIFELKRNYVSEPLGVITRNGNTIMSEAKHEYSIKGNEFVDMGPKYANVFKVIYK